MQVDVVVLIFLVAIGVEGFYAWRYLRKITLAAQRVILHLQAEVKTAEDSDAKYRSIVHELLESCHDDNDENEAAFAKCMDELAEHSHFICSHQRAELN